MCNAAGRFSEAIAACELAFQRGELSIFTKLDVPLLRSQS